MGFIREPEGVDFTVISREPTEEEMTMLRDRIREDNEIRANNPAIFSFDSYPNGKPTEHDLLKMMKEMERLRKQLHKKNDPFLVTEAPKAKRTLPANPKSTVKK